MASMNIVDLVKGLLNVALIALAVGHQGDLRTWAAREAFKPWHTPHFFLAEYARPGAVYTLFRLSVILG